MPTDEGNCDSGEPNLISPHLHGIDLKAHGIDKAQAAELLARLSTFAEDWNASGMDAYDNYEAHSLRGVVIRYDHPVEPVAAEDWESAR
ncbi:MAG: hypothetical protein JO250_16490 [Armatimonadetes bacterium]|nr:hypothetical protein [Armatimonadota bacterium]